MSLQRHAGRSGHIAVPYKGSLIIWGGFKERTTSANSFMQYHHPSELFIYDCSKDIWICQLTKGDIPQQTSGACGVLLNDRLYVYGGYANQDESEHLNDVVNWLYTLDLQSLVWTFLQPAGIQPLGCDKLVGWEHNGKLYFFGGVGEVPEGPGQCQWVLDPISGSAWNNQLVSYNPQSNCWEWPSVSGQVPSPRAAHASDKCGPRVFISGGRLQDLRTNDLYILDMDTMTWSEDINLKSENVPLGRSWHSFTFVAPDRAIMFGGLSTHDVILNDHSIANFRLDRGSLAVQWHPLPNTAVDHHRIWHRSAFVKETGDFVCHGGRSRLSPFSPSYIKQSDVMVIIHISPPSLLRLCYNAALQYQQDTQKFWKLLPTSLEAVLRRRALEECS